MALTIRFKLNNNCSSIFYSLITFFRFYLFYDLNQKDHDHYYLLQISIHFYNLLGLPLSSHPNQSFLKADQVIMDRQLLHPTIILLQNSTPRSTLNPLPSLHLRLYLLNQIHRFNFDADN